MIVTNRRDIDRDARWVALPQSPEATYRWGSMVFRVVSYNIRTGIGMDGVRSIQRVADVLARLSPDVVCLQEVDQRMPRSWLANQPKFLSTILGMRTVFQRNISHGIGGYGNCVLIKSGAIHCRCHPLPSDGEPRGCVEVRTVLCDREVVIFNTHLAVEATVRHRQAHAVYEITRAVHHPKVLCGDMNDGPGSSTLSALLDDPVLRDSALEVEADAAATYIPTATRIDFILADLRFAVKSYEVVDTQASDHRPVVVDLEMQ